MSPSNPSDTTEPSKSGPDHSFDAIVQHPGVAHVPADWMQGRATFGGLVTARVVAAVQRLPEVQGRPVRLVSTNFVGPLGAGANHVQTELLRSGRSVAHVSARLVEEAEDGTRKTRAMCLVAAGADRPSAVHQVAPAGPTRLPDGAPWPAAGACQRLPYLAGVSPAFTQHVDYAWAGGGVPFSGEGDGTMAGWCRHRTQASDPTQAVLGLLDAWPSPSLAMVGHPAPVSSVTWTAHLVGVPSVQDPGWRDGTLQAGWWAYEARTVQAQHGHVVMEAKLWRPDGVLAAWSEQLQAIFDRRAPSPEADTTRAPRNG